MPLITFHGHIKIKDERLVRVKQHQAADEIIQGTYYRHDPEAGGIIWAIMHNSSHSAFEVQLGIPYLIARLADNIFEYLPDPEFKEFPVLFLSSVPVGVLLRLVPYRFFIWFISGSKYSLLLNEKSASTQKDLKALADYIAARVERSPTPQEKTSLNATESNLIALSQVQKNYASKAGLSIITLFKDIKQAWACDHAIKFGYQAYRSRVPEMTEAEAKNQFGKALSQKLIELIKSEKL